MKKYTKLLIVDFVLLWLIWSITSTYGMTISHGRFWIFVAAIISLHFIWIEEYKEECKNKRGK